MVGQIATAFLLVLGVLAYGLPAGSIVGRRLNLPLPTRSALVPLAGLAILGAVTFLAGTLSILGWWLPPVFTTGGLSVLVIWRAPSIALLREFGRGALLQFRAFPLLSVLVALGLGMAMVASLARPSRTDEIEYHWAAALAWAADGRWTDSPFRHVDGFPFMEIIFTSAATQGSYVAAHLLHLLTLVGLGLGASGVGRALGIHASLATAAAAIVMPVAWDNAYVAYNDTAVGSYIILAVAIALGSSRETRRAALAYSAIALALAASIKPTAAVGVGLLGSIVLLQYLLRVGPNAPERFRTVVSEWIILTFPVALTLTFWTARQFVITGNLFDPVATGLLGDDVPGMTAEIAAIVGIPNSFDHIIAPVMPLVLGIVGNREPWGGRISLIVQVFLVPAIAYVAWRRGDVLRRFTLLALPAWLSWVVLGIVVLRTRFHIASWVLLVVAIRLVVEDACAKYPRVRPFAEAAWVVLVALGLIDVTVEMYETIALI